MRWFPRALSSSRRGGEEVLPSPNIWYYQKAYEVENRAQDVDDEIWRVLAGSRDWSGADVLDIGCGDGFHLPRFAATARSVVGVEPHEPLVRDARNRVGRLANVEVRQGRAQRLPLPDAAFDVVHARTAYFFGPGCEPGLREAERVLRPGGLMMIVDLDVTSEPYGRWMRLDLPHYDPPGVEKFFARQGFDCRKVMTRWSFEDAAAMEAVLKIEFSAPVAAKAIAEVCRLNEVSSGAGEKQVTLPVGYRVHTRVKPTGLVVPDHSVSSSDASSGVVSSASPRIP
ncbi:class I SAM-dependent methyltransferase [Amycolatopsis sp. EV170708-02-1]|uniref:class I SAM-dependent methyltransferase n=1 Tax=Amycolatopsis sp. EV170708-02-1 TaxID=2919322 RepID=UPI001F0C242B|nr:class I SAM-dependent methyltransferase [Amycolatopsis sp. EV170708-02-1]UMP00470.1 class I SAM-dependent methyltransferase [Amycolatopsis sp. EV170708-02-1]